MTFADWVRESVKRYRERPLRRATVESARAFYHGANRRIIDPYVGRVWWERGDWDILVIMDATRVDLARETLAVPVESVYSPASTSIDWIERHFADKHHEHWENAAYVTGNPFADHNSEDARSADLDDKDLGYFDPVYKDAWQKEPVGTTPPEIITERAVEAWREQDVNQMIVHYMQPHQPFRSRPEWEHVYSNLEDLTRDVNQGGPDIWGRIRDGELDESEVWDAYKDNLWWVWCNIHTELIPNVSGRVIVTADHGNGLGEWGSWSHHGGDMNPHVRRVPVMGPFTQGLDVEDANTKDSDSKTASSVGEPWGRDAEDGVADQLNALGYR